MAEVSRNLAETARNYEIPGNNKQKPGRNGSKGFNLAIASREQGYNWQKPSPKMAESGISYQKTARNWKTTWQKIVETGRNGRN